MVNKTRETACNISYKTQCFRAVGMQDPCQIDHSRIIACKADQYRKMPRSFFQRTADLQRWFDVDACHFPALHKLIHRIGSTVGVQIEGIEIQTPGRMDHVKSLVDSLR